MEYIDFYVTLYSAHYYFRKIGLSFCSNLKLFFISFLFSNSENLSALLSKFWKMFSVNIICVGGTLLGLPEACFHYTS